MGHISKLTIEWIDLHGHEGLDNYFGTLLGNHS